MEIAWIRDESATRTNVRNLNCIVLYNTSSILQGVPEKVFHSWEPKKLGPSYSETKHLLDLKLRQQRALMSTPCSQSLRPNRCVVSEYEVPNFFGFPRVGHTS